MVINYYRINIVAKRVRNSILKNIELEDTTLYDAQLVEFMRSYGHEQLDSRVSMIIYNLWIQLFSIPNLFPQT